MGCRSDISDALLHPQSSSHEHSTTDDRTFVSLCLKRINLLPMAVCSTRLQLFQAVFLFFSCLDFPSWLEHLTSIGWATLAIWAAIKKYSHNYFFWVISSI